MTDITEKIATVLTLCALYKEHLKDAFWEATQVVLGDVVLGNTASLKARQQAIEAAFPRAFNPEHWQFIVDCIGKNYDLLWGRDAEDVFFRQCEYSALQKFATDEKTGIIPVTFQRLTDAKSLTEESLVHSVHLTISSLNALVGRDAEWGASLVEVATILEAFYLLKGENGKAPDSLRSRFDAILKKKDREVSVPAAKALVATEATFPNKRATRIPERVVHRGPGVPGPVTTSSGKGKNNPFDVLDGKYKPNGAIVGNALKS